MKIKIGTYPQTRVGDEELIKKLNSIKEKDENGYVLYEGNYYLKEKVKGTEYNFTNIDNLSIINNKVVAKLKNGKEIEVFSPNAKYDDYIPFDGTKGLPELSLDHKNSLYDIIELNYSEYKCLEQLSKYVDGKGYKSKLLDDSFIDNVFINDLKKDLTTIINKTQLVVMSKSLNSSKNSKKVI